MENYYSNLNIYLKAYIIFYLINFIYELLNEKLNEIYMGKYYIYSIMLKIDLKYNNFELFYS